MDKYNGCNKDCPNRHPGCHDSCEKYQTARAEREKDYEERKRKSNLIFDLMAVHQKPKKIWYKNNRR